MPILDPVLQIQLLNQLSTKNCNSKSFFFHSLRTASLNKNRNVQTIETSINFKNHLKDNIEFVNDEFGCKFYDNNFIDNIAIKDYYRYFYDHANTAHKAQSKGWKKGFYKSFTDKNGLQTKFFQPYVSNYCNYHSWFLTCTPIAVLCIDTTQMNDIEQIENLLKLIIFEIDLMLASGFTLVLCAKIDISSRYFSFIFKKVIFSRNFSEIHLNFTNLNQNPKKINYEHIWDEFKLEGYNFKLYGYTYIYTPFIEKQDEGIQKFFYRFNNLFRVNHFNFSKETIEVMMHMNVTDIKPFVFCTDGFKDKNICVKLCNVPLYENENEDLDWTLSETSGNTFGYILSEDFLKWQKIRVKITIFNESKNCYSEKYVDFNDIHLIKPDFYVEKTLFLTDSNEETLNLIDDVKNNVETKTTKRKEFVRENFFSFFQEKKYMKGLVYVTYAYVKYASKFIRGFDIHYNQIFTALNASKLCLFDQDTNNKGVIYQVDTGEGKSCIIQIIAAVLALMKKNVHIVSSNITLSIRDYYNSYMFFNQLGLTSAVLLHYNELPFSSGKNFAYNKDYFPEKFFAKKLFKNSSNLNYSVCGFENEKKKSKNKANIVFSTIVNFECFYLKMMEMCPGYITNYFNDCILLIDEVDSILIDEITNGTIVSRPIKSNGSEVLQYVYESRIRNDDADEVLDHIKENWPKCTDITLNDIESMFDEIDMVNQDEFIDGKKYLIETHKIVEKDNLIDKMKKSLEKIDDLKEKAKEEVKNIFTKKSKNKKEDYSSENDDKKEKQSSEIKEKNDDKEKKHKSSEDKKKRKSSKDDKKHKSSSDKKEKSLKDEKNHKSSTGKKEKSSKDDKKHKSSSDKKEKSLKDEKNHKSSSDKKEKSSKDEKKHKSSSDKKKRTSTEKADINNDDSSVLVPKEKKHRKSKHHKKHSDKKVVKIVKEIIPFDYDHKGILEPNKEFNGYAHQFIAIKEILNNKENENMIIKDISLNYLYVSHPIFVQLYSKVVGLTGTIGDENDRQVFEEQYKLSLMTIPREKPKYLIELPMILCDTIDERNEKIVKEIIDFNKKEYPVLVIFQDLNEITIVLASLISKGIKNINIFDGKDEKMRPDRIAGLKGAISLGTNVCGRGTDIQSSEKPLHVIVSYFTSNQRVMGQAFGRTARQGHNGTVRIICLERQFYSPFSSLEQKEIEEVLDNFKSRNLLQMKFIEEFRKNREWIFSSEIKSQPINDDDLEIIRSARINVNRIVAYNYEFPICMSIPTFLLIQAQKIFSLYNCPNCKYTWMIFQKYVREMILASWSLFLEKAEKSFLKQKRKENFTKFLEKECKILIKWIKEYLPDEKDPKNYEIMPTFIHIYQKILQLYENNVMKRFAKANKGFKQIGERRFCSFSFGFKPYTLIDSSGAKINHIDGTDQDRNFIVDPELKYMRKQPNHHPLILSITEKIDDIFNLICNKINEVIGGYVGLKFFLRRTLGGCEFGVCFDFDFVNDGKENGKDFSCLIDQDPLLMFTITVKSMIPILAGILIIGLVYIATIAGSISEWIAAFPEKITKELVKKTVVEISKMFLQSSIENVCDKIIEFLFNVLNKQIIEVEHYEPNIANILQIISKLASPLDFSAAGDLVNGLFDGCIKIDLKSTFANSFIKENLPIAHLLKIGLLLLLCFASFMIKFHYHKKAMKFDTEKASLKYDKTQDANESVQENKQYVDDKKMPKIQEVEFIDE